MQQAQKSCGLNVVFVVGGCIFLAVLPRNVLNMCAPFAMHNAINYTASFSALNNESFHVNFFKIYVNRVCTMSLFNIMYRQIKTLWFPSICLNFYNYSVSII